MKTCFKCGVSQPLSEFYRHSAMADGHLGKCKQCTKRDALEHRNSNLEKVREYDRSRANKPHRIQGRVKATTEYRKRFPERYRANRKVAYAVRTGTIAKQPCFCCGSVEVEAHHADYSRPLDVVWLCAAHHKEIHLAFPDDHYDDVHNPKPKPAWRA